MSLAGKVLPWLALGVAATGAVSGWNNAAAIHGKAPEEVTTGDKFQAAGANAASWLTAGLISPQQFIQAFNNIADISYGNYQQTAESILKNRNFSNYSEGVAFLENHIQQQAKLKAHFNQLRSKGTQVFDKNNDNWLLGIELENAKDSYEVVDSINAHLFNNTGNDTNQPLILDTEKYDSMSRSQRMYLRDILDTSVQQIGTDLLAPIYGTQESNEYYLNNVSLQRT